LINTSKYYIISYNRIFKCKQNFPQIGRYIYYLMSYNNCNNNNLLYQSCLYHYQDYIISKCILAELKTTNNIHSNVFWLVDIPPPNVQRQSWKRYIKECDKGFSFIRYKRLVPNCRFHYYINILTEVILVNR